MDPRALARSIAASASPGMARQIAGRWAAERASALVITGPRLAQIDRNGRELLAQAEAARDMITSPQPKDDPMPAPANIAALPTMLAGLMEVAARASKVGEATKGSIDNLNKVLDQAEGVKQGLDTAAAQIQAALGLTTNGGPA